MSALSGLAKLGLLLAIVGGVNWALVGITEYNFVADIFGDGEWPATTGERVIYLLVGAGVLLSLPLFMSVLRRDMGRRRETGMRDDYRSRGTATAGLITKIGLLLVIIGAVNWGLVGIFDYNFVADIFGEGTQTVTSAGERVIYILVLAGGILSIPLFGAGLSQRGARGEVASYETESEFGRSSRRTKDEEERRRAA